MLSGIKVGKKKPKKQKAEPDKNEVTTRAPTAAPSSSPAAADANTQAAAVLKQQLLSGTAPTAVSNKTVTATATAQRPMHQLPAKPMEEWSVAELAAAEKLTSTAEAHQETTSNIMRHYKHTNKRRRYVDSDDEEQDELRAINVNTTKVKQGKEDPNIQRHEQRHQHQAVRQNQQMSAALSKSWWWFESTQFKSHTLLAQTEHLTLVCAAPPPWATSEQSLPWHFFLVPVAPATSFRVCDAETVMKQVHWFHKALQQSVYPKHAVIVTETVIPGGKSSYWQAKLDVWIVPQQAALDVPLFLRQELAEHGYEPHALIKEKPLHRAVPPKFPYLYIQYEPTIGKCAVQVLDTTSKISPHFWSDLLAGAVRSLGQDDDQSKSLSKQEEQSQIQEFQKVWSAVDKAEIFGMP